MVVVAEGVVVRKIITKIIITLTYDCGLLAAGPGQQW